MGGLIGSPYKAADAVPPLRRIDRPPTDAPINDRPLSIDINLSTLNNKELMLRRCG
jgi:hypothetical protein